MEARDEILALLRRNGMYAPDIDLKTLAAVLLGQLRLSFYGGESSVYVRPAGLLLSLPRADSEPLALALLGRERLRTFLLRRTETGFVPIEGETFDTPGAAYPATLAELIYAVAELSEPLLQDCESLLLCLDLPTEPLPGGDCALCGPPPALSLREWEGKPLKALLRAELASRGLGGKTVALCSAAAATLLDGQEAGNTGRLLGLRWGLGLTAAFAAPPSAVVKLRSGESRPVLFDAGLGGCTGVPFAPPDLAMDRDSPAPGRDLLEKMLSTAELGERFRFTMIKAVEARLLTFMCGRDFLSLRQLPLAPLLDFLREPEGEGFLARFCSHHEEDRAVALSIGHAVLDRAARLAAAAVLATAQLVGAGEQNPVLVSLSGEAAEEPLLYEKLAAQLAALGMEEAITLHRAAWPCLAGACRAASCAVP